MKEATSPEITYREYLTLKIMGGLTGVIDFFMAQEAIASTAIEHPERDMNEVKTLEEWEKTK